MSIRPLTGGLSAAAALTVFAGAASADILLIVDLTVPNEVTITATNGNSYVDASGSDTTGFYMADFYGGGGDLSATLTAGDLTNAENPSDFSPSLFRGFDDPGLNVWSFSSDSTVTFTAGSLAFVGSGNWTMDATDYADMVALGNRTGDVYFPADTVDDLSSAVLLGEYAVRVPAPASAALLGLGGLAAIRRRR